jgi:hypothetical protein
MAINRITGYQAHRPAAQQQQTPPKHLGPSVPQGFVVCPPHLTTANNLQQEIYRLAYERAQAAMQIPRHHRLLFSVWN